MAYDWLKKKRSSGASKEYLKILHLAARENEAIVDYALRTLIEQEQPISIRAVEAIMGSLERIPSPSQITIAEVDLCAYDALLSTKEEVTSCYQMS
jgi:hypothetical protein